MSNNTKLNILILTTFSIFITTYFSFSYYHDDFIMLFEGLYNYKKTNSIISLNVLFKDRYLHNLLVLKHFEIIGDNLSIYNLIKIFHIIFLASLLVQLCKLTLKRFQYRTYISYLLLLSPFLLGTTFWQTNITWLFFINLHFAILILFIKFPNTYLLILSLLINHVISINLQFLIFNYLFAFIFLEKLSSKISLKKYYSILITNVFQIFFSIYIILKTTEKNTNYLYENLFLHLVKSFFNNLLLITYDLFQLFSFFFFIIILGVVYLSKKYFKYFDKNSLYPLMGILFNLILFITINYNFRLSGIESRVSFLVGFYIHFLIIILFEKINNKKKIIAIFAVYLIYLIGYTNHYLIFSKLGSKQNDLVKYLSNLNPEIIINTKIDVSDTTFDTKEKIKYFLFVKTNNDQWLKSEFEVYNNINKNKILKNKILEYLF